MSDVSSVSNSVYDFLLADKQRTPKKELGQEDFLSLLVAQLSAQDPLEPTSNTDFIAQMAQFTSLNQMKALSSSSAMSQAYGLVGKIVYGTYKNSDTGATSQVAGTAESLVVQSGTPYLMVNGYALEVGNIIQVFDGSALNGDAQAIMSGASLIGKNVTAVSYDSEGNEETISGKVEKLTVKNGVMLLKVGDKEITFNQITQVE